MTEQPENTTAGQEDPAPVGEVVGGDGAVPAPAPPPPAPAPGSLGMTGMPGNVRSPVTVILLSIITLGIYGLYWQYASFKELKDYNGEGIGGWLGLLFAILLGIVNVFLLPYEVGRMYVRAGRQEPVSALTGFWALIPFVGWIIWVVKVQGRMNDFWESVGNRA